MTEELCVECDAPTGKAGRYEDSLYLYAVGSGNEWGPICEICYQFHAENDGLWSTFTTNTGATAP